MSFPNSRWLANNGTVAEKPCSGSGWTFKPMLEQADWRKGRFGGGLWVVQGQELDWTVWEGVDPCGSSRDPIPLFSGWYAL